jgi:hypothetical protein
LIFGNYRRNYPLDLGFPNFVYACQSIDLLTQLDQLELSDLSKRFRLCRWKGVMHRNWKLEGSLLLPCQVCNKEILDSLMGLTSVNCSC